MREIKLEVMFECHNADFERVLGKHYTTVSRLISGEDNLSYAELDIICKRQFTGLKDKDGIEIYEGDILSHRIQEVAKVVYGNKHFDYAGFTLVNTKGMTNTLQNPYIYSVVGNIYENPELI